MFANPKVCDGDNVMQLQHFSRVGPSEIEHHTASMYATRKQVLPGDPE